MDIFCYGFAHKCITKDLLVYALQLLHAHPFNCVPKIADTENEDQDDIIMIVDVASDEN